MASVTLIAMLIAAYFKCLFVMLHKPARLLLLLHCCKHILRLSKLSSAVTDHATDAVHGHLTMNNTQM